MSHSYGYAQKKCLFSMPSDLLVNPSNPVFEVTFPPHFLEYYERKPNAIKSFGLRIAPVLDSSNINTKNNQKHSFPDILSWCITKPTILSDLHNSKKPLSDSHLLKQELQSRLSDYYRIATMKRSVFLMTHLFSLLNPRLLIWLWITLGIIL